MNVAFPGRAPLVHQYQPGGGRGCGGDTTRYYLLVLDKRISYDERLA